MEIFYTLKYITISSIVFQALSQTKDLSSSKIFPYFDVKILFGENIILKTRLNLNINPSDNFIRNKNVTSIFSMTFGVMFLVLII